MAGQNRIARALYFAASGRRLVVVRVFVKKSQKTPRREIALAERRMKEQDETNKPLDQLREELLAKPAVREAYEDQAPEFAIARAIIAARAHAGLSQAELAARMATSQPFVARLESGRTLPSMRTLLKVAAATGTVPEFRLRPKRAAA